MDLTGRRKQFLQKVTELYNKTRLPVHYATLAKALGVSKWTAYDMLNALEKQGYLTRDYETSPGETGRSQVVFRPAENVIGASAAQSADASPDHDDDKLAEEWRSIKSKVVSLLNRLRQCSANEALRKAAEELPRDETRVAYCAHVVGLLLLYLNKLGGSGAAALKHMIRSAPTGEMRLSMLAGVVTGTVLKTANHELSAKIADWAARCMSAVGELSERERGLLSEFLNEALA
jgi:hypothetical protein